MSNDHPESTDSHALPGERNIPFLHGPLSKKEQWAEDERQRAKADREADNAYKSRQIALTESSVKLTKTNVVVTWILAVFTAVGAGAAIYQGVAARVAAEAAKKASETADATLKELQKNDITSGKQFETQLGKLNDQAIATREIAISTQHQQAILNKFLDAEIDKNQASMIVRNPKIVRDRLTPLLRVEFFNSGVTSASQVFYTVIRRNSMGISYVNDREATASELKIMGTQYGPKKGWSQTQDISGNGIVPIDFPIQEAKSISDTDVAQMIKGRIEYESFGKTRWRNFCLLVTVRQSDIRYQWDYTPRFCVVGQEGDKA